jgi:large subunit ribosomal protein L21
MKKAVIESGNRQYIVKEGDVIEVNFLAEDKKVTFDALLVIDGDSTSIGTPTVTGVKVEADVVEAMLKGDKVTAIRYKAKKRVNKVRGHRQTLTQLKITKIS